MLRKRLVTGSLMAAIFVAVLVADEWLAPWYPFWLVVAVGVTLSAGRELVGLLGQTAARPSANAVLGGALAVVLANWGPHVAAATGPQPVNGHYDPGAPLHALAWPMLAFAGVVMFAFLAQGVQFRQPGATMATIAGSILAVAYLGVLGSFLVQIRWMEGPHQGLIALAALVATAKGTDVGAYTFGRLAGRHKLWPALSPNKTVEGALGGLLLGTLGALAVVAVAREILRVPSLTYAQAIGFGLLVSVAAQAGDLMESMIKREGQSKDASAAVPGFGGVLDVVDSLIFAGPVAFLYWLGLAP